MKLVDLLKEFNVVIDTTEGLTELRSLILGLAVRGKLVPQDPNDEPASELLKKIEAEKQRKYNEGVLKKPRGAKEAANFEKPYKLPSKWEWVCLNEVYDVRDGTHDTPNYQEQGIPLVTSKNIYDGILDLTDVKYISEKDHEKISERSSVEIGDILFAMIGTIGNSVIVDRADFSIKNVALFKFISKELSNSKFLKLFLDESESDMLEEASGGVQAFVSLTFLRNYLMPLPPLSEQHRIVQKIESLFAEVDDLEAKLSRQTKLDEKLQLAVNAEVQQASDAEASKSTWNFITSNFERLYHTPEAIDNLKKNILNEAVRGRLVPQDPNDEPASELLKKIETEKQRLYDEGEIRKPKELPPVDEDEIPFEIPESWEWARVETIGLTQTGTTPKTSNSKLYGDYIPFIGPGDISKEKIEYGNNGLSEMGLEVGRLIPEGSVVMVCIGGSIGKCDIVDRDISCNQQINTIAPVAGINSEYIKSLFKSDYFQVSILSKATGSATPIINRSKWGNIPFSLPPLEEQHRIVGRIEELFAICDRFKAQLELRQQVNEKLVKGLVGEVLEGV